MSYDQAGRPRRVVRLQLVNPVSTAMVKLLALKEGNDTASEAELEAAAAEQGAHSAGSAPSRRSSSKGSERDAGGLTAEPSGFQ